MLGTIRAKLRFPFFSLSLERWRRYSPMLLTIGASLGLTIGLFVVMRQWEGSEKQAEFDYASKHYVEAIRQAIERIELTHEAIRQNYYGSPGVSRKEFSLCAEPFLARVPSLKVLQWAPRVPGADRGDFEERVQREGWPKYRIIEPDSRGQLVPAEPRDEYFPIWYAATKSGFKVRFGWDFGANPVLRKAIEKCRDTGKFVVSEPIDLSNIGINHPLVQTFLPVYRDFQSVRTVEDRRTRLEGLLVGLCQVDDLVEYALSYVTGPQGIDVEFLDESLPAGQRVLHYHASRTRQPGDQTDELNPEPAGIHYTAALAFGGQRWSLVCTPAPDFFPAHAGWRSWTILAIGLVVTWLSASYIFSATTRTQRIQRLVDQRTVELRKKDDQLRQSQKLEAVGALAGGIAHEFNNLLQAIGGYTRYAMEELKPEDQPYKDLESVLQAADRAATLTRQLLSFSRRQSVERKNLDANQMVADLAKMLRPLLGEQIQLKLLPGEDVGIVFADPGSFQQVLINLCLNARDAMPSGGDIVVKTERVNVAPAFAELYADLKPGRYVELSVADTGHGMTAETLQHIFEPFFTTKPVGQGTGLGLPTVYGIVQQHEGAVHVYSEPSRGTTFKIYLPAVETADEASSRATILSVAGGPETILLAEDDPMVCDIARRILVNGGYTVLTAADGEEALDVFRAHRREISLVLLDAVMPKLTGPEAYRRLKDEYPEARVVFCSGYDPETAQSNFIVNERLRLVEKPYNPETLLRTVREVLDAEELCPAH